MYFVIYLMQWMGLLAIGVVAYVMTFHNRSSGSKGWNSVPNWNFAVKRIWAEWQLRKKSKDETQKAMDFQNFKSEQTSSDYDKYNSTLIYGSDAMGNSLFIKLVLGADMTSDFVMALEVNSELWTLPETYTSTIVPYNRNAGEKFEINGLTIECIRPFRKWRITFAGYLAKGGPSDIREAPRFMKFNFFWTTSGPPQHWPADWSPKLKAEALAAQPWRHGYWLDYLGSSDYGGFDQFGSLFGQLHLTDTTGGSPLKPIVLNLPGVRQRRRMSYDAVKVHGSCSVFGVCSDGNLYLLESFRLDQNLSSAQHGYVRKSNGQIYAIDWTDFKHSNIPDSHENLPKAISISFSANGQEFSSSVCASNNCVSFAGTVPRGYGSDLIKAQIGINGTTGYGIVILSYANRATDIISSPTYSIPMLKYTDHKPTRLKIAYWFTDSPAQSEQIAGGKGASLALLTTATKLDLEGLNYTVPNGFVLSVSALNLQLNAHPTIVKLIDEIRDIAYQRVEGDLEKACDASVIAISGCPLEPEVEQTISKFYRDLQSQIQTPLRLAVRSSAVGEDSDDCSAAGQNETFLGLSTVVGVNKAVQKCWASLYSIRSVEYRRQHLQPINAQMAVVVQTMVDSDCAGVLFTCDPKTGDPKKMLITANYGLGESVVSGAVDPDSYIIRRESNNTLSLYHTNLGTKAQVIHMSDKYVFQDLVDECKQNQLCLTEEQALRLARIGVALERMYGSSRDIEWAVHKDQIYLLQSRPITTLNHYSNWELLHEMDSPIMSNQDLHSFANFGEIFPECTSPLTLSSVIFVLQKIIGDIVKSYKPKFGGIFPSVLAVSHYRIMFDVYNSLLTLREENITINDKLQGISLCGHEYLTPDIHRISIERQGITSLFKKLNLIRKFIIIMWTNKTDVESLKRKMGNIINRFNKENLEEFKVHDAEMLNNEINFEFDDSNRLVHALEPHLRTTHASSFTQVIAMTLLAEGSSDISPDHYNDIAVMLRSSKGIESAEIPQMLEQICHQIYLSGLSTEFISIQPGKGEEWILKKCPMANTLFTKFITNNAHRAIQELDIKSITWGMNPSVVIEMLQSTCRHLNNVLTVRSLKNDLTYNQIIKELRSPKKSYTRKVLSYILPLCQVYVQRRESTKSCLVAYVHEMRKAYIHLASLLVKDGLLPDRNLIFYFDRDDLQLLIAKNVVGKPMFNKAALVSKAQRRMRLFPQWNTYRFEEFNMGIVYTSKEDDCDLTGVELVKGTSVIEGLVTGRACVITSLDDVSQIQAGDILVTLATDIGWSTYFPILGGVVTELGGLISHGAVVAREYGIPCVVGAVGATRTIKHNDLVTLNATDGIIFKVKDSANDA